MRGLARASLYPECCGAVERWPRVCEGTYLLLCPFFEMSFSILRQDGQLGFIVSNAFTRRELGGPLGQDFFPIVDLQKTIDCSGLVFPGHGTPTSYFIWSEQKARAEVARPRCRNPSRGRRPSLATRRECAMEHVFPGTA